MVERAVDVPEAEEFGADFILATDKRREVYSVQRLEPALGGAFPDHAPHLHGNGKPL